MTHTYDVALWRSPADSCLAIVDYIEAEGPFTAVLSLMGKHSLRRVSSAAARPVHLVEGRYVSAGPIERFDGIGFKLLLDALEEEEVL